MPYFKSSQEWLEQSVLLLEARPSTTRVTTRYDIKPVKPRRAAAGADHEPAPPKPARGSLVLKTYDPVSGVVLKYRTTKAAEVSRLVYAALGRLGRAMAAVPADVPDEAMPDAWPASEAAAAEAKADGSVAAAQTPQSQQAGAGRKKKKGRR